MYQAPDFIKVSVNVKDVYAAYGTACPPDETGIWMYTMPCEGTPDYMQGNMVSLGFAHQCYSTQNA